MFDHAPHGRGHHSAAPEVNTGDGLRLGEAAGGAVADDLVHPGAGRRYRWCAPTAASRASRTWSSGRSPGSFWSMRAGGASSTRPTAITTAWRALAHTGVTVAAIEIARLKPETDVASAPFFERGRRLGARSVLVAGDDPEEARLTGRFAALARLAAGFGLTVDLEFMP